MPRRHVYYERNTLDWVKAHKELLALLFDRDGRRRALSGPGEIQERILELYHFLNEPDPSGVKKRTRFGDKRLPIASDSLGRYNKMTPQENTAGIFMGLGLNDDCRDIGFQYPLDERDDRPYVPLHRFALDSNNPHHQELNDAMQCFFRTWVPYGTTVDAVSFRLYAHGTDKDENDENAVPQGTNTQRSELATRVLHIGANIVNMEALRGTFAERSGPAYDAFVKVLSTDLKTEADNDEEDEDEDEGEGEEEEEEDEEEEDTRQYDRKRQKLKSIDRAETAQSVDLFHNKVSRPRGTKHCRQTKFKGDAPPHIAELFWAILGCEQSDEYKNRIPTVGASTYNSGASLHWYPIGEGEGMCTLASHEMCKLEEPSENPDGSTVVTAKIRSMPKEERDYVEKEYVELQTMAFKINWMMRDLFKQVADSFDIVTVLELEDCQRAKSKEYLDPGHMDFTQRLVLFHLYMDAIYEPPDEEQGVSEEEDGGSSEESESDPEDEEYNEPDKDDSDDEDDDDDSDGDASNDEDSGEESE